MINFNQEFLEMFLSVVRKYMQLRGGLSQKDLAEKVNHGVSSMSRFLNKKTKDLDPQLIAAIVGKLQIPIFEIIDFIEEDSLAMFKRMVLLYKDDESAEQTSGIGMPQEQEIASFEQSLDETSTRTKTSANIRGVKVPFGERRSEERRGKQNKSTGEKLAELTARQKGFLTEFLDLDMDGKDLVVSTGEVIIKYLNRKPLEF